MHPTPYVFCMVASKRTYHSAKSFVCNICEGSISVAAKGLHCQNCAKMGCRRKEMGRRDKRIGDRDSGARGQKETETRRSADVLQRRAARSILYTHGV